MKIENGVLNEVKDEDIVDGKFEVPEGVKKIGMCAFKYCRSLTEIIIPRSVIEIDTDVFWNCMSLTKINVNEYNHKYSSENGVLYNKDKNQLIKCPIEVDLTQIIIPDSVTEIQYDAFRYCKRLTSITIPNSVTDIGSYAFNGCNNLKKITIPDSVTEIRDCTFSRCSRLEKITIPDSIISIGSDAFEYCRSLTEIIIPNSVTQIGYRAFKSCDNLAEIIIPNGVKEILPGTFEMCNGLVNITIPESVTEISSEAFRYCYNLKEITIPSSVKYIGKEAFEKNTLIKFSENVPIESIEQFYIELEYNDIDTSRIFPVGFDDIKEKASYIFGDNQTDDYVYEDEEDYFYDDDDEEEYFYDDDDYTNEDGKPDEIWFDIFLGRMMRVLGKEEAERIFDLPELTEQEVKEYMLEKDEMFNELYTTKYRLDGDIGATIKIFKALSFGKYKAKANEKNSTEMQIFREINNLLENSTDINSIQKLVEEASKKIGVELQDEDIEKIKQIERKINGHFIENGLNETKAKLEEGLSNEIVGEQVKPVSIMITDEISKYFKENVKIEIEDLKEKISERLEHANAPYIRQNKDVILNKAMEYLQNKDTFETLNHSAFSAMRNTKESIGKGWKYKINQAIQSIGYNFETLPEELTEEQIQELQNRLGIQIDTKSTSVLKDEAQREEAYKLLKEKNFPRIMTYQQMHDMFGSVHEPYTQSFRDFFIKNRERFLTDPKCIIEFGRIQSNFDEIVNSNELKNLYEKGTLTIENILGYLESKKFANMREGDEKLAKLTTTYGAATNEEEFAHVQKIFDILKKREASSVPPIYTKGKKYRGRMLEPDDVLNMFAGNITTCCQRFNDVGEASMLLGCLEDNTGIFVIEEIGEDGKANIVGQSLVIRQKGKSGNNDRLCFDNIEIPNSYKDNMSEEDHKEILEIYKSVAQQAIEKDRKFLERQVQDGIITQEACDNLRIKEVIAGTGYNDLHGLTSLPKAEVIVPEEAFTQYTSMQDDKIYPWIDSSGGKAPSGSKEMPVVLAKSDERVIYQTKSKLSDVSLCYGTVGEVKKYSSSELTENRVEIIKQIEKKAYREEQQIMNNNNVQNSEDIQYEYGLEDFTTVIGGNNNWYLIYEEREDSLEISDLAIEGAMNSENNTGGHDVKLATMEAFGTLYELFLEAGKKGKSITCNATKDTSLKNIQRMLQKKLIQELKDKNDRKIVYDKEKGLIYEDNGEKVEYRTFNDDGEIEMLDLSIEPNVENLTKATKEIKEILVKVKMAERMKGGQKNPEIDEARREIRDDMIEEER